MLVYWYRSERVHFLVICYVGSLHKQVVEIQVSDTEEISTVVNVAFYNTENRLWKQKK